MEFIVINPRELYATARMIMMYDSCSGDSYNSKETEFKFGPYDATHRRVFCKETGWINFILEIHIGESVLSVKREQDPSDIIFPNTYYQWISPPTAADEVMLKLIGFGDD
jgi:hypothetical protein